MKEPVKNIDLKKRIFDASGSQFGQLAIELFHFQYQHNGFYRKYCDLLNINPLSIDVVQKIPFLPISFFKSHNIKTTEFEPEVIFESSGTTLKGNSKHCIRDLSIYRESFIRCFERFYGPVKDKCIIGLLPAYLERKGSSLVLMVEELITKSNNELGGFYLYDHEKLYRRILHNEIRKIPTILIGLTYAILDFATKYPMQLRNTIIMETGGMKGRMEEMTRQQVHTILQEQFGPALIHSEYGMTELLSQAYSKGDGIFHCPPWMKVLVRNEDDPLEIIIPAAGQEIPVNGVLNIIDLANIYSCCFIATEDLGRLHANGSFEVIGRLDNSDIRGCSLMIH